jgi:hypothetical protein
LALLRWARANGCEWDEDTSKAAAKGGHLATLQWVRANGCPWSEETCRAAVRGAHLAVLLWARANGCPWGPLTVAGARALMEVEELDEEDPLNEAENAYDSRPEHSAGRLEAIEAVVVWLLATGCPEG